MPKRKNPFGEAVPVQLKTHVTAKHVASKKDMEEVYSEFCIFLMPTKASVPLGPI